jgi:hypothetical protein
LSQLDLLGFFFYSHPSGKSTCHFQGNYALVGDAVREVVWTLFTYGGCNKGGSFVLQMTRPHLCGSFHFNLYYFIFNAFILITIN